MDREKKRRDPSREVGRGFLVGSVFSGTVIDTDRPITTNYTTASRPGIALCHQPLHVPDRPSLPPYAIPKSDVQSAMERTFPPSIRGYGALPKTP